MCFLFGIFSCPVGDEEAQYEIFMRNYSVSVLFYLMLNVKRRMERQCFTAMFHGNAKFIALYWKFPFLYFFNNFEFICKSNTSHIFCKLFDRCNIPEYVLLYLKPIRTSFAFGYR